MRFLLRTGDRKRITTKYAWKTFLVGFNEVGEKKVRGFIIMKFFNTSHKGAGQIDLSLTKVFYCVIEA
jgi:hypothetical protein